MCPLPSLYSITAQSLSSASILHRTHLLFLSPTTPKLQAAARAGALVVAAARGHSSARARRQRWAVFVVNLPSERATVFVACVASQVATVDLQVWRLAIRKMAFDLQVPLQHSNLNSWRTGHFTASSADRQKVRKPRCNFPGGDGALHLEPRHCTECQGG
jgi:hypothetical protein